MILDRPLVQRELDTLTYYTDFAASMEQTRRHYPVLKQAASYGERALNAYQLYLAAMEDLVERVRI